MADEFDFQYSHKVDAERFRGRQDKAKGLVLIVVGTLGLIINLFGENLAFLGILGLLGVVCGAVMAVSGAIREWSTKN